ncbi:MAG TPA: class I SAM-dependent methyltransferase [Gammaproteobacteria bacterium]|nr:class I SAM-dependent methyltransferase [Gammaproteobacteria bacterium]
MRKSLSRIYDEFADTYEESRGIFDMSEVFDTFYQRFDTEKGSILDLGCGAGEPLAATFIKRGWSVTGVDFSQRMLELAARYVPDMDTIHADMRNVEFGPGQFDAITIIYALFHLPRDEHAVLFAKIFDWLRPNGKLLFTYATREYTGQLEFDGYKEFMGQQLYYSHKSPERLYADLEMVGFDIEAWDYRNIGGELFLWVTANKPA